MSISVVYWSGTGNTQAMAEAVAEGIKAAGQEAELLEVGNADAKTVAEEAAFALGCPAMGAEVLEESEMEPFVEELESYVSGKKILLFGSYGWGDGEWMTPSPDDSPSLLISGLLPPGLPPSSGQYAAQSADRDAHVHH